MALRGGTDYQDCTGQVNSLEGRDRLSGLYWTEQMPGWLGGQIIRAVLDWSIVLRGGTYII